MDIVDGQVHSNMLGAETTLAIMDAIGIQSVLIDEYTGPDADGALLPAYKLHGGVSRPIGPSAEAAALSHPDRFAFLMRVNPFDPGLEEWIDTLSVSPNLKALRVIVFGSHDGAGFEAGGCERLFAAANAHGLPVFVTCPARLPHLAQYIRKFPGLQFIVDHCGASFGAEAGQASLDDTLRMAGYPNVALKWAHAPRFLSVEPYPFADLEPKLAAALDAFGRKRILWASDYTVSRDRQNWAESLFYIRHSPVLSASDKEWILGRTIRTLLNWPAPAQIPEQMAMHPHRLGRAPQ